MPLAAPTGEAAGRRRWLFVGVAVLLVVIAVAILTRSGDGGNGGQEIRGSFVLLSLEDDVVGDVDDCSGSGGYDDFGAGMDVTIKDQDGKTIGNSSTRNAAPDVLAERLAFGETFGNAKEAKKSLNDLEGSVCVVLFEADVDDARFYEVEVGRRGNITYSRSDLEEQDWYVELTLGV